MSEADKDSLKSSTLVQSESLAEFDPVEALLSGITSSFMRAALGFFSVLLAYAINIAANTSDSNGLLLFPFAAIFTIFAWAFYGGFFVIGLLALLGGLYTLFRFILDEGGKTLWFLLLTLFVIYFSPMNFTRTDWVDAQGTIRSSALSMGVGDPLVKHDWLLLLALYATVFVCYWLLPGWISAIIRNQKAKQAKPV